MDFIRKIIMEDKCLRCGKCCAFYVKILDNEIILPSYHCKHFKNGGCDIYETRTCLKGKQLTERKAIPTECPYAPKGYKGRKVASQELEKQIFNTLPADIKLKLINGFEP